MSNENLNPSGQPDIKLAEQDPIEGADNTAPSSNEPQSEAERNAFAGVKKGAEEKGRREGRVEGDALGYQRGIRETQAAYDQQMQQMGYQEQPDYSQQQPPAGITKEELTATIQEQYNRNQLDTQLRQVNSKGIDKYADFSPKVQELINRGKYDADIQKVIEAAYSEHNGHEVAYKLATDENALQSAIEVNPRFLAKSFKKLTTNPVSNDAQKQQPLYRDAPAAPASNLPANQGGKQADLSIDELAAKRVKDKGY